MKKDLLLLLLLLLPGISWLLQPGFFPIHDDLQTVRQLAMDKCFADRQIPCRWSADLGNGFGYPLFNFYPPLPYLLGQSVRWLGFQYIDVIKVVGVTGFVVTALFMYLLAREFWGRGGGLLASILYTYAPYHAVDFYVRGAMNEFWAMALFPAILWTSYSLLKSGRRWLPWLTLSLAGLLLAHNLMLLIFAPLVVVWCLFWLWQLGRPVFARITHLILAVLWALGLAAFFTLPVIFESRFIHVESLTSGYFNFLAHFLSLKQIFYWVNWGYGGSYYGLNDSMSFFLGYLHWLLPAALFVLLPFIRRLHRQKFLLLLLLFFTVTTLFMTHYRSAPVWLNLPLLKYLQFPWRFLTLAVFSASLLSGAVVLAGRRLLPWLLLLLLLLNANYFRPRTWFASLTDTDVFSGDSWLHQISGSNFDYLPIWAPLPPAGRAGSDLNMATGSGSFLTRVKKPRLPKYSLTVAVPQTTVELQTLYFPGWRVWLDGQEVSIDPTRDPLLGRMQADVPQGQHTLTARFTNTPIRTLANTLSLISWFALLTYLILAFTPRECEV